MPDAARWPRAARSSYPRTLVMPCHLLLPRDGYLRRHATALRDFGLVTPQPCGTIAGMSTPEIPCPGAVATRWPIRRERASAWGVIARSSCRYEPLAAGRLAVADGRRQRVGVYVSGLFIPQNL